MEFKAETFTAEDEFDAAMETLGNCLVVVVESVVILDFPDVSCGTVNEAENALVASREKDSVMRIEAVFDVVPLLL